ncbi:hypothetical protein LIA77_05167 [Sarocladium implicatum]|nr:hypothetical protein LIA77_05167 [Sarocladium implicatum]
MASWRVGVWCAIHQGAGWVMSAQMSAQRGYVTIMTPFHTRLVHCPFVYLGIRVAMRVPVSKGIRLKFRYLIAWRFSCLTPGACRRCRKCPCRHPWILPLRPNCLHLPAPASAQATPLTVTVSVAGLP